MIVGLDAERPGGPVDDEPGRPPPGRPDKGPGGLAGLKADLVRDGQDPLPGWTRTLRGARSAQKNTAALVTPGAARNVRDGRTLHPDSSQRARPALASVTTASRSPLRSHGPAGPASAPSPRSSMDSYSGGETRWPVTATRICPNATLGLRPSPAGSTRAAVRAAWMASAVHGSTSASAASAALEHRDRLRGENLGGVVGVHLEAPLGEQEHEHAHCLGELVDPGLDQRGGRGNQGRLRLAGRVTDHVSPLSRNGA